MTVFEKIEAQQKGKENTAVWMCGEQLKDICRSDPHCAEIVCQDLDVPEMSIAACEKKIKAYADQHKSGPRAPSSCVPPNVAEGIIRKFYGLPETGSAPAAVPIQPVERPTLRLLDLL
ncbi:MAG: hypothetical protein IJO56_05825 [Oscillospiraceae bacterium]|nr:hypothetical protein [Oscillospiraceae bacterium]